MGSTEAASSLDAPITLHVKTIESQTHTVNVLVSETVLDLKEKLAVMLQVPSPRQRLIFRGRVMVDDKPLTEYSLQDGQTIHLVTRPADAPQNQQNDAPRIATGSTASGAPLRFDTPEYLFSIIGVDDNMDAQNLMQALAGTLPADMEMEMDGHPTVIHIDGDPATIRSLFGNNSSQTGGVGEHARTRTRASRSVPLGASLPHLATIEAELTRASTQLRNVQTILAHPADQLEGIELESLDVPELESVDEDVDGDSTDLARMVSILTQLAETNRSMANHLQTLSNQYGQSLAQPSERLHLQRVSLRAARAMYRLASVQNTVFPMLANATFVGNAPGAVTYRFQPASRMNTILREPQGSSNNNGSAGTRPSAPQRGSLSNFPFSILSRGAAGGRPAPLGLIPSIMAHARASAQNVNAALSSTINTATRPENASTPASASSSNSTAATAQPLGTSTSATPSSGTSSQLGARPIGRMIFGPNDSLSYTIQSPTRSSRRTNTNVPAPYAAAAAAATSPFASHFTRLMIPVVDQSSGGFVEFMRNLNSSFDNMEPSNSSQRTSEPTLAATVADFEANLAASRAINDATEQLERTLNSRASSRRRERPDDFSDINDGRATSRRRLTSQQPSFTDYENRVRQELEQLNSLIPGSSSSLPAASSAQGPASRSTTTTATTVPSPVSPQPQATVRPAVARTSSNEARRSQADSPSTASSPSPSSPSLPSPSATTSNNNSSNGSPAYNLGRIGVFISAILRMVDQPREDGSPRRLADVICNDPESPSTPLQDLVRNVAESVTVRETRSIVEGHPAPLRNIHPVLNSFIRERALNGQQLTESNLDSVAVMFAHAIMDAVHVDEILETLSPPASIQITSEDIRRISLDVLREHFRRLIYLVVAAPTGRESNWPTFARDVVLWIRDVVGSWRVAFYGLFPERDQAEAQRIATHVVGSAIHANGRRWVELSNRATNTLVNVLCANIVPRRREEQGGLVGGAWPLMATADRQNTSRPRGCTAAHSLLGSTAPPAPLGPTITAGHSTALEAETLSENLTRRITQMMAPLGLNISGIESLTARSIRDAVRAELSATRSSSFIGSSTSSSTTLAPANTNDAGSGNTTISASSARANNTDPEFNMQKEGETRQNNRKTRVEEVEDEDMS